MKSPKSHSHLRHSIVLLHGQLRATQLRASHMAHAKGKQHFLNKLTSCVFHQQMTLREAGIQFHGHLQTSPLQLQTKLRSPWGMGIRSEGDYKLLFINMDVST
jgi:hypothetical protein